MTILYNFQVSTDNGVIFNDVAGHTDLTLSQLRDVDGTTPIWRSLNTSYATGTNLKVRVRSHDGALENFSDVVSLVVPVASLLPFSELFTGANGTALSSDWEVTRGISGTGVHVGSNKIDIQNNRCQFNVRAESEVGSPNAVELRARFKKCEIDWASEKRTITWKQQAHQWYLGTVWGIVINSAIATENGATLDNYIMRVTSTSAQETRVQMKNADGSSVVYNQGFAHGVGVGNLSTFALEINPAHSTVRLLQDGVEKLVATTPNLGKTKGWLYLVAGTRSVNQEIKDIDDLNIT